MAASLIWDRCCRATGTGMIPISTRKPHTTQALVPSMKPAVSQNYAETINYVDTVEGIRQDIWDKFGDGSYAGYDADDGVYDTGSEDAEVPQNVNAQTQPAKAKKQPKQAEVPDTIRVWPPITANKAK